ncbi:MAG: hypothetical protein ACRDHZ_04075 [Ktedonobacteraceae bacterium]
MDKKALLFGPDSVWINVFYGDRQIAQEGDERLIQPDPRPLDTAKFEELTGWQEQARQEEKPVPTTFMYAGAPLLMYPNSGGLTSSWRFILRNRAIELKVGMGKRNGIIGKVRFSAEHLWDYRNLHFVLLELHIYLADFFFESPVYLGASEVHICADTVGYDFAGSDWQQGFIRRSAFTPHFQNQNFVEEETKCEDGENDENDEGETGSIPGPDKLHMRYRPITGFTFGSHKSAVSAVIYNKSHYIKYKAKTSTWFYPLWTANGWDGAEEVWRVEVRCKRPALNDMDIHSAYDLVEKLPGIWQYATQSWLRYVVPDADSNRTRWQVHEAWLVVQMAYQQAHLSDELQMGPVIREHKRVAHMDQMVAQLVGCLITLHAWRKDKEVCEEYEDISEVLHDFYPNAIDYLEDRRQREERQGRQWDFVGAVRYKQVLYSLAAVA